MASLNDERQRLEAVLASMSDAVMMVNAQGELVLTNAAFTALFGDALPALEDASGQRLAEQVHPARLAARGETFTVPFTCAGADGSRQWFEASGRPIRMDGLSGGVVVIRDVSDRSLRQLEEQFVALASHELRTPLTAMRGALELLQRALGGVDDERVRRYIDIGLVQSRLLADLVQDLADVVRVRTGELPIQRQAVDLVELTRGAVELGRPMTDQEIRVEATQESLPLSGDRRRLQQVVLNLLANAVQHGASPRGVDVLVGREGSAAVLEVVDHGPGIPPEHRDHIFERFYRAEPGGGAGLGVGLYLVRAIVAAHGGSIDLRPTRDHGSTFVVRLPLVEST
jgi:two-component system CheB/CheR fusion protein